MGFRELVRGWPEWRGRIRSESRKRGFDFLAAWLPSTIPNSCRDSRACERTTTSISGAYPMQDRVLGRLAAIQTGFYLTGGTAASRAYLHHCFSDDLDFFVNDDDRFGLWAQRIIQALVQRRRR